MKWWNKGVLDDLDLIDLEESLLESIETENPELAARLKGDKVGVTVHLTQEQKKAEELKDKLKTKDFWAQMRKRRVSLTRAGKL